MDVVWGPVKVICWVCFIIFSIHVRSLKMVVPSAACHVNERRA